MSKSNRFNFSLSDRLFEFITRQASKNSIYKTSYIKRLIERDYYMTTNVVTLPDNALQASITNIDIDTHTITVKLPDNIHELINSDIITIVHT